MQLSAALSHRSSPGLEGWGRRSWGGSGGGVQGKGGRTGVPAVCCVPGAVLGTLYRAVGTPVKSTENRCWHHHFQVGESKLGELRYLRQDDTASRVSLCLFVFTRCSRSAFLVGQGSWAFLKPWWCSPVSGTAAKAQGPSLITSRVSKSQPLPGARFPHLQNGETIQCLYVKGLCRNQSRWCDWEPWALGWGACSNS